MISIRKRAVERALVRCAVTRRETHVKGESLVLLKFDQKYWVLVMNRHQFALRVSNNVSAKTDFIKKLLTIFRY